MSYGDVDDTLLREYVQVGTFPLLLCRLRCIYIIYILILIYILISFISNYYNYIYIRAYTS
jgi:hypothetical protein